MSGKLLTSKVEHESIPDVSALRRANGTSCGCLARLGRLVRVQHRLSDRMLDVFSVVIGGAFDSALVSLNQPALFDVVPKCLACCHSLRRSDFVFLSNQHSSPWRRLIKRDELSFGPLWTYRLVVANRGLAQCVSDERQGCAVIKSMTGIAVDRYTWLSDAITDGLGIERPAIFA